MEKKQQERRRLSRLATFAAILTAFVLCFLALFQLFETISIRAMLRMNTEFSAQVRSLSDSMESLIHTIGTQVFYISPTAKLRQSTSMTRNERVFALRELWQYVSASQMLHSIYIDNGRLNQVYTTDNDYVSAPPDSFYDQGAVRLFRARSADNRMKLIYRTYEEEGRPPLSLVSYLVFEINGDGRAGDSAVMLNLFPAWFSENLLNFSQDRYIVLSQDGFVVATQDEGLSQQALQVLPRVTGRESGYFIDRLFGEKTVCFHSPIGVNNWYCLRFLRYEDCLPGLSQLRRDVLSLAGALLAALFCMLLYALLRVYFPYRRLALALRKTNTSLREKWKQPAFAQLNEMVAASRERREQDALRSWLGGRLPADGAAPSLPATLYLTETRQEDELTRCLATERGEGVTIQRDGACLTLCAVESPLEAAQLCSRTAAFLGCRCYYSRPVTELGELPQRAEALRELQALRLFSPGQQTFSETLLDSRTQSVEGLEPELNAVLAAAKTDTADAAQEALNRFLEGVRGCRYADALFVMKRLDHLLDGALPESAPQPKRPTLEALLADAESPAPLAEYYRPRLNALVEACTGQRTSRGREVAAQVKRRVELGFRDAAISVQTIAEEMGLSPAYLRKQFFSVYGVSVGDCLNDARVEEACRLLRETRLPVEQIARQIGFENTKYLFVLFKKRTGQTPRQYRNGD